MFKIIMFITVSLLFVGCMDKPSPSQKSMKPMSQMFQSVKPEEATLVQNGEYRNSCVRCGMNLTKFYKTSHAAIYENKPHQYCSMHCLADHLNEGIELKNPQVVDVTSLKLLPVLDMYYVVGSSKRGTMSRISKYAFSSLVDAQKFQKENGGKIMDFNAALKVAQEDFN